MTSGTSTPSSSDMVNGAKVLRTLSAALLALAAGCATVRAVKDARLAQDTWADRGTGKKAEGPVEPVRLIGWKLPQIIDFALANRPDIARARLEVENARLALREVAADAPLLSSTPWNSVDASVRGGHSEQSEADHRKLHGGTDGSASASLSLDILLYDFGRNAAQSRVKVEQVIAAEINVIDTGYSVFEEVAQGYFKLLENEALLEVAHVKVAEYKEHLEQAEMMLEFGEAKEVDVLKSRLDLAKAEQDVVSASNDVITAGATLMAALGVDASMGDYMSVLGPHDLGLDKTQRFFADTSDSVVSLFDFSSTNAPAMRVVHARLRAASHQVDVAVADLYPTVSASLSLNWADPLWYWNWGVSGVQSLFTGWRKTAAVERATIALDSAAQDVNTTELDLSSNLELAVAERDNAVEALATARVSVRRSKENLETVREQYNVGDVSRVDFTDAASDYTQALGDRVKAFYRGQIAEARLYRLTGRMPKYSEETISEIE